MSKIIKIKGHTLRLPSLTEITIQEKGEIIKKFFTSFIDYLREHQFLTEDREDCIKKICRETLTDSNITEMVRHIANDEDTVLLPSETSFRILRMHVIDFVNKKKFERRKQIQKFRLYVKSQESLVKRGQSKSFYHYR